MNPKIQKTTLTLTLLISYLFLPRYGFTDASLSLQSLHHHLLYPISHANIWHLLANILCLWMLRCPMHLPVTYTIAVLCSFIPSPHLPFGGPMEPTIGFSGAIFAMVGISWGKAHRFRDMLRKNIWYLIIPAFIPHINFLIHIYCLLAGYLYARLNTRSTRTPRRSAPRVSAGESHHSRRVSGGPSPQSKCAKK